MVENNANKLINKKNGEEDNNTIAQRFLNIFRQLHVFTPERKQAFDELILAQPPEIRGMFGKLLGGSALQEYVNELEKRSGLSREGNDTGEEESEILNRAIENNSQREQTLSPNALNNSQIQTQLLEMMSRVSQTSSVQAGLDIKNIEGLVSRLMRSQSEFLANISNKQTEQISKIITLSLQESYRASTRSFIEAVREMNHESINAIRETLNYQNNKPIILSNYINNSNPTQVNNNSFEQQGNFSQPPAQNFGHPQQNQQQLKDLEGYAQNQIKNTEFEENKKKKKKNKNKKKDNYSFDDPINSPSSSFLDDDIPELKLPSFENEQTDYSSPLSYTEQGAKGLDYSLFGDETEKNLSSDDTFLLDSDEDDEKNYVYEEHYVDAPLEETKQESRENLKDKILNKAKKLIKGGNVDHLNFDINSIDDVILDPEIEERKALEDDKKGFFKNTDETIEDLLDDEKSQEEWEWVEEAEDEEDILSQEMKKSDVKKDLSQTYIHEDNDFINIGEEALSNEENSDEEWEWVEETEDAEETKPEPSTAQGNEWVWEYDDADNPEAEEEWVWEYEELPEAPKSPVDKEPIAFEEEYYEPEGKAEVKTNPFSSKGLLEQESRFKFDGEKLSPKAQEKADVQQNKVPSSQTKELFSKAQEMQETKITSFPSILENIETPASETLMSIGDLSSINLEKKKKELVENIESTNGNFLYNNLTEEDESIDDIYNK